MKINLLFLLFSSFFLFGCNRVFVSVSSLWVGDSIDFLNFQSKKVSLWPTDGLGRLWTTNKKFKIDGTCTRGINLIVVTDPSGNPIGNPSECDANGNFLWSYTVSGDGVYPLVLKGITLQGTVGSSSIEKTIVLRTISPPPPIITTNNGASFSSASSQVAVDGNFFADAVTVYLIGSGVLSINSQAMSFQVLLSLLPGQTQLLTFFSVDLAGNQSNSVGISVSYLNQLRLNLTQFSGVNSGSAIISSNHVLKNAQITPFVSINSQGFPSADGSKKLFLEMTQIKLNSNN